MSDLGKARDLHQELTATRNELAGVARSDARFKRKAAVLAEEISNLLVKAHSFRHEIRRLEDLLDWVARTSQPIEEIRHVIDKTIARRRLRDEPVALRLACEAALAHCECLVMDSPEDQAVVTALATLLERALQTEPTEA